VVVHIPGFVKQTYFLSAWKLGDILNRSEEVVIDGAFFMTTSFPTQGIKNLTVYNL
jgi:hypothetical protein